MGRGKINFFDVLDEYECWNRKCINSVFGEFSSGVSICRNKVTHQIWGPRPALLPALVTKHLTLFLKTVVFGISRFLASFSCKLCYWAKQRCHTFSIMGYCFFCSTIYALLHQDYWSNWLQSQQFLTDQRLVA